MRASLCPLIGLTSGTDKPNSKNLLMASWRRSWKRRSLILARRFNGCSPTQASVSVLTRCFFDCSSACEFSLSGYIAVLGNDFGRQARLGGIEKFLDRVAWYGELVRDRFIGKMDFAQAKRGQLVKAFMDGQVEMTPMLGESLNDAIGEHDHETMASRPGFEPYVDRPHLQMHRFALAKGPLDEG
jgi:hypothetical protein